MRFNEQKKYKKSFQKEWILLLVILLLVLALWCWRMLASGQRNAARDQVRIGVNQQEWRWVALDQPQDILIQQGEARNVVRIDQDGNVYMLESNCPGGDCLAQGSVNKDNMARRILGGQIICLPHKLTVELLPAQESNK